MAQINLNKSSPANYELVFPVLPVTTEIRDTDIFTLNIYGTIIPSITLETQEMDWMGGKFPIAMSPLVFEPWYVNFNVDSNWCNWFMLYKWVTYIDDGIKQFGRPMIEYFVDAHLHVYDNANNRVMGLKIINI